MLSVLDIILISLGGACVVTYAILKVIQLRKFKKMVALGIEHGLTETEARKNAYESVYNKAPKKEENPNVNDNDESFD